MDEGNNPQGMLVDLQEPIGSTRIDLHVDQCKECALPPSPKSTGFNALLVNIDVNSLLLG